MQLEVKIKANRTCGNSTLEVNWLIESCCKGRLEHAVPFGTTTLAQITEKVNVGSKIKNTYMTCASWFPTSDLFSLLISV